MSLYDYQESQRISAQDPPFYALIMACFRKADSHNLWKLRTAFPQAWHEFQERYHAPGGLLEHELPETIMEMKVVATICESDPPTMVLGSLNDYDHSKEEG